MIKLWSGINLSWSRSSEQGFPIKMSDWPRSGGSWTRSWSIRTRWATASGRGHLREVGQSADVRQEFEDKRTAGDKRGWSGQGPESGAAARTRIRRPRTPDDAGKVLEKPLEEKNQKTWLSAPNRATSWQGPWSQTDGLGKQVIDLFACVEL